MRLTAAKSSTANEALVRNASALVRLRVEFTQALAEQEDEWGEQNNELIESLLQMQRDHRGASIEHAAAMRGALRESASEALDRMNREVDAVTVQLTTVRTRAPCAAPFAPPPAHHFLASHSTTTAPPCRRPPCAAPVPHRSARVDIPGGAPGGSCRACTRRSERRGNRTRRRTRPRGGNCYARPPHARARECHRGAAR